MTMNLTVGKTYQIEFHDPRQDAYTWYSGEGIYVGKHDDDFGEGEQHHEFTIDAEDGEIVGDFDNDNVIFPESAIFQQVEV